MNTRSTLSLAVGGLVALTVGCANNATTRAVEPVPAPHTTSAQAPAPTPTPKYDGANLSVAGDIMTACKVTMSGVDRAPKFAFDDGALLPQGRDVLSQVATCMTTGPLKGRSLRLVGRADPRGETEYNFALGEHRAGSVQSYLMQLGVNKAKLAETSRGKLDATGKDEAGWQNDRRVDLVLQ